MPGDGGIIDQCGLVVAPIQRVAVDGVVAGVADAIREPAAIDAGVFVENFLRFLIPVEGIRGLTPETLRVALPARIDLVIAACAGVHRRPLPGFVFACDCGTPHECKQACKSGLRKQGWRSAR